MLHKKTISSILGINLIYNLEITTFFSLGRSCSAKISVGTYTICFPDYSLKPDKVKWLPNKAKVD